MGGGAILFYLIYLVFYKSATSLVLRAEGAQLQDPPTAQKSMKLPTKSSISLNLGHNKSFAHNSRDFSGASRLHHP